MQVFTRLSGVLVGCTVAVINAMLWLVTGVSSFGSSTSSVTPREPNGSHPSRPLPLIQRNIPYRVSHVEALQSI